MHLSALYRYPLKSSIAEPLQASSVDLLGLQGDRRWMLVDETTGRFFTQRADPRMSQLSALYTAEGALALSAPGLATLVVPQPDADQGLRGVTIWKDTLQVPDAGDAAAAWASEFMGKPTRLVHVPESRARFLGAGFSTPDDRVAFADGFPLLLIGEQSLADLSHRVGRPLECCDFGPTW